MASKGLGSAKVTLNCPVFYTSQCWQLPWLASWAAFNGTSLGGGEMTVFEAKKTHKVNLLRDAFNYRDMESKWHFLKGPE